MTVIDLHFSIEEARKTSKLSDTQFDTLVEIFMHGKANARSNTFTSLQNKGLLEMDGSGTWSLTEAGRKAVGVHEYQTAVFKAFDQDTEDVAPLVEQIEGLLNGDPWSMGDLTVEDEQLLERQKKAFEELREILDGDEDCQLQANTYDSTLSRLEQELCGFEATIPWRNTQVWDGLTAIEIKEDMKTARPINRKANREARKALRKVLASL